MSLLKRVVIGVLATGSTWLVLGGHATAQQRTEDTAPAALSSPVSSARSSWQQRVLRRTSSTTRPTGTPNGRALDYRLARQPTRAEITTSPGQSDGPQLDLLGSQAYSEPLSADVAYDPIADLETHVHGGGDMTAHGPGCSHCGGGGPVYDDSGGCGAAGGDCDDCGSAGGDFGGGCAQCDYYGGGCGGCGVDYLWGMRKPSWMRDLSFFAGVHGFKGPADLGRNGNFGFQEGVNFGSPIGGPWAIGFQAGVTAVQSNFNGNQTDQSLVLTQGLDTTTADRDQIFFTAGLFHRAPCGGWQGGVAFDLLHDTYFDRADLTQIRSELGYVMAGGQHEFGFWGAYGSGRDTFELDDQSLLDLDPTDQFNFYIRRYFAHGGEGRLWAGFTGRHDGILGGEIIVPVGRSWAIESAANLLLPRQSRGTLGQPQESWGLAIQAVWYLGQPAQCAQRSLFRPLFRVADNGTFMYDVLNH